MRKTLLILFCAIILMKANAQVVFCPPGAEWRYNFASYGIWSGYNVKNETIKYTGDSIIGNDTFKILRHHYFYINCNYPNTTTLTLIKQKGDTIFFKNNKTQNSWQILFNFACNTGDGWQTTFLNKFNAPVTYSYIVSSTTQTLINNVNLKQVHIEEVGAVTERMGWEYFLFWFHGGSTSCDDYHYEQILCYQDSSFGQHQFTSKPCDYSNLAGISDWDINNNLNIHPNPVSEILNIDLQNAEAISYQINLVNLLGEEVHAETRNNESRIELDIHELKKGIYFLQIFNKDKLIANDKIIKD